MNLNTVLIACGLAAMIVASIVGVYYRSVNEARKDAAETWKEERDAEKAKADRLEREMQDMLRQSVSDKERLLAENQELAKLVGDLKTRTDLSGALRQMRLGFETLQRSASDEHKAILQGLKLIADTIADSPGRNGPGGAPVRRGESPRLRQLPAGRRILLARPVFAAEEDEPDHFLNPV